MTSILVAYDRALRPRSDQTPLLYLEGSPLTERAEYARTTSELESPGELASLPRVYTLR